MTGLRSPSWFEGDDLGSMIHRAYVRSQGVGSEAFDGRPVVGVCNSWSELVSCNVHLRAMAAAVKRGVVAAGGVAFEFPTMSLGETLMKPTSMLYRNLVSMDVEETIRSNPLDAIVLLAGCDKTVPAQLMGAASADVPAIMVVAGPREPGSIDGRRIASGTDLWHATEERRAGRMDAARFADLEGAIVPTSGTCAEMGTASTMAALAEALGISLPGTAAIPAVDGRRLVVAEETGRRAVGLAREDRRPSTILTDDAFDNAVVLLAALGGSTNAVVHLLALAGRLGVPLTLDRIHEVGAGVPLLTDLQPAGRHLMGALFEAGGVPALMNELRPHLKGDAMTVTGMTIEENVRDASVLDRGVIASLREPLARDSSIAVVRGTLAPDGAIVKRSAASSSLLRHRGPALVFDGVEDLAHRIDDPALDVDERSVFILRGAGPKGAPGMPEWGQLPVPERLLRKGVRDTVRISDARMSGTAFGTVVLHVAPEAAAGGPLAIVRDGDPVMLDVERRRLDVDIDEKEMSRRLAEWRPADPSYRRGYGYLFLDHVLQANLGCDLDFLRHVEGEPTRREPLGLVHGWIGGW